MGALTTLGSSSAEPMESSDKIRELKSFISLFQAS
jgi:hypothetical protein